MEQEHLIQKSEHKKGATVTILQTSNGWHKIELSGGKIGWVSADYIKITTNSNSGSTSGGDSSNGSNDNTGGVIEQRYKWWRF